MSDELRKSATEATWGDLFDENVDLRRDLSAALARAKAAEGVRDNLLDLICRIAQTGRLTLSGFIYEPSGPTIHHVGQAVELARALRAAATQPTERPTP